MHRITVCATCESDGGRGFAAAIRERLADGPAAFEVRTADCLSCCASPLAVAFDAPGKATYLFAGIDPEADLGDAAAFAGMYASSPDGWIEDARPAGRMRHRLIGRVPA